MDSPEPRHFELSPSALRRRQQRNRVRFQHTWEDIIAKYAALGEHEQGDMVNILTGEVEEDTGHLLGLRDPHKDVWSEVDPERLARFAAIANVRWTKGRRHSSSVPQDPLAAVLTPSPEKLFGLERLRLSERTPSPSKVAKAATTGRARRRLQAWRLGAPPAWRLASGHRRPSADDPFVDADTLGRTIDTLEERLVVEELEWEYGEVLPEHGGVLPEHSLLLEDGGEADLEQISAVTDEASDEMSSTASDGEESSSSPPPHDVLPLVDDWWDEQERVEPPARAAFTPLLAPDTPSPSASPSASLSTSPCDMSISLAEPTHIL